MSYIWYEIYDVYLYINILPAKEIKKKWMTQNKVVKPTSCTHWWEKRNLTSFYILGLFQTITANVAIEKKYSTMMHFLRELFAKTSG